MQLLNTLLAFQIVLIFTIVGHGLKWSNNSTLRFNESVECFNIFNTSTLLNICSDDESICACNLLNIAKSSDIGVFSAGSVRTFPLTYWSSKKYVLDINQAQVVYVFQGFNASKLLHQIALKIALTSGMAVIAHNKELWESLNSYAVSRKRIKQKKFSKLDKIQTNKGRGGIIDMWTNVNVGYILLKRISILYKKHYKLVLKTRPDVVHFTPLNMKHAINNWKANKLSTPYLDYYDIQKGVYKTSLYDDRGSKKVRPPDSKQMIWTHITLSNLPPLFSPGCDTWGGISDKLFFGPMEYIEIFTNVELVKEFFTVNTTYMNQYRVGASEILAGFTKWTPDNGLERPMKAIAIWYHIPVTFLSVQGSDKFIYGKLKWEEAHDYCSGKWHPIWLERACLDSSRQQSELRNLSVLEIGAPLQHTCQRLLSNNTYLLR